MRIPVGIVGVTGYAGQELLRILLRHPCACVQYLGSRRLKKPTTFGNSLKILPFNPKAAAAQCEILFLALPHGEAMRLAPELLKKSDLKIVDFSGDFRLKSTNTFRKAYGMTHTAAGSLKEAVYGLPELHRSEIPKHRLVANPGCYPTATLLALAPLAKEGLIAADGLIVDAKSGVTGAGRSVNEDLLFCEVNEDLRAYKVDGHQHTPEMEQELGRLAGRKISLTFVPHLVPMNRGLYATLYVTLKRRLRESAIRELFERRYDDEPFIRILPKGSWPRVQSVAGTNACEIGLHLDPSGRRAVLLSAIDNLGKGAAGQAVQNMNLLFGLPETTGLTPSSES